MLPIATVTQCLHAVVLEKGHCTHPSICYSAVPPPPTNFHHAPRLPLTLYLPLFPLLGPLMGGVVVQHQQPVYSVYGKTLEVAQLLALTAKGTTHTCVSVPCVARGTYAHTLHTLLV